MAEHPVFCDCRLCLNLNRQTHQIADLRAQVARLEAERDAALRSVVAIKDRFLKAHAATVEHLGERDAAIERGVQACEYVSAVTHSAYSWRYDALFWRERTRAAERDAEAKGVALETLRTDIGHWVMAYGPDLVVYPSKEEAQAVNKTPEFIVGRNATMQVVSEGLQAMLTPAEEEAPKWGAKTKNTLS